MEKETLVQQPDVVDSLAADNHRASRDPSHIRLVPTGPMATSEQLRAEASGEKPVCA